MTTRRGPGVLTTILMLIPMLAIPVMALFGVPHFMPVVASPTPREHSEPFVGFRETRTGQSDTVLRPVSLRTEDVDSVDLFLPIGGEPAATNTIPASAGSVRRGWTDPLKSAQSRRDETASLFADDLSTPTFDKVPADGDSVAGLVTIFDSRPAAPNSRDVGGSGARYERSGETTRQPAPLPPRGQSMSWRQASKILDELGVQTYSLSPGLNPGEFRFVCLVSSTDDPRVSRRFESHSTDPLVAVEQVIGQVTRWTRSSSR